MIVFFYLFSVLSLHAQDDARLINITTLEQLNVIRYDLDGNGAPSSSGASTYRAAFGLTGTNNNTCVGGCIGYELINDLDFDDLDNNGTADDPSKWSEICTSGCLEEDGSEDGTSATVGWMPINAFGTIFEGNRHAISNLYINRKVAHGGSLGFFSYLNSSGKIRDLGLEDISVTSNHEERAVFINTGGLVGQSGGTVTSCYVTGSVTGANSFGPNTGGLVGTINSGSTVTSCYATGSVVGRGSINGTGGLVGTINTGGTIMACYATGNVSGDRTGGLVGNNYGTISACYATGNASGYKTGGLVGSNGGGVIRACYATGSVRSGSEAGGLAGNNTSNSGRVGRISECYATGSVTGRYA